MPLAAPAPLARPDLEPRSSPKPTFEAGGGPHAATTIREPGAPSRAGSVGENKFLVEVAVDARALPTRTCKPAEGRRAATQRPPSLRHGHKPKVTWYHPRVRHGGISGCSKKKVVW